MIDLAEAHTTHNPEPEGARLLAGCVFCRVCMHLLAGDRAGVTDCGRAACTGPVALDLRHDPACPAWCCS